MSTIVIRRASKETRRRPDKAALAVYVLFLVLLAIASYGVPFITKAFYAIPLFTIGIWALAGGGLHRHSRLVVPFVFLLVLCLFSLYPYDFNTLKKTYFILVYSSVFFFIDFSRVPIDFRWLLAFFVLLEAPRIFLTGPDVLGGISVTESRSALESTFAFPIGLLSIYFLTQRRIIWFLVGALFALIFLKRIVLLAIIIAVVLCLLPRFIRRWIVNPIVVTFGSILVVWFSIDFGFGTYDEFVKEITGKAANDFSKGRAALWGAALNGVEYHTAEFLPWGVGVGKVITILQEHFNVRRILLHNDLLSLVLEAGWFSFVIFVLLLNWVKGEAQRLMAAFMTMLLATDNVLIYQHVMFVYLMIQQDLEARRLGKIGGSG